MNYKSVILFITILSSCSNSSVPLDVLKPEAMQQVMWDVLRADVFSNQLANKDSAINRIKENIRLSDVAFKLHHTNREQFEKSMTYYSGNPELFKKIIDSLNSQQGRKNQAEMKNTFIGNPKAVK